VGNVGIDPEVRTTDSGIKVARLKVATTERQYNKQTNESKELTEWHTIILWRNLAEVTEKYVKKGSQLYIEGRLRTREWTDKDNIKRYSTEIVADELKLLGRKGDAQAEQSAPATQATPQKVEAAVEAVQQALQTAVPTNIPEDDLPF
jgi:single-strand DNA-binding protein